eukprot:1891548-Amphidinium_carterae.2
MAPKKPKAKPKSAPTQPPNARKRTAAGRIFSAAEEKTLPSAAANESKKRRLVRNDTDELTRKCLRDNFAELDDVVKFSQPSSSTGLTLYETVLMDKREKRRNPKSPIKFGLHYFAKLRTEFSHCVGPLKKALVVQNTEEDRRGKNSKEMTSIDR